MRDLQNPNLSILKGGLFLVLGIIASLTIVFQTRRFDVCLLLAIAIWACCRFYYFAFYVIEHYVDDGYKFDGLYSALTYLLRRYFGKEETERD